MDLKDIKHSQIRLVKLKNSKEPEPEPHPFYNNKIREIERARATPLN